MDTRVRLAMEDSVTEPGTSADQSDGLDIAAVRRAVKVEVVELAATWAMRKSLDFVYNRATGLAAPNAMDRDVPYRRILIWAAVTAAAVAVTNVVVDRAILRPRTPQLPK